jgi:hypothetical protein
MRSVTRPVRRRGGRNPVDFHPAVIQGILRQRRGIMAYHDAADARRTLQGEDL